LGVSVWLRLDFAPLKRLTGMTAQVGISAPDMSYLFNLKFVSFQAAARHFAIALFALGVSYIYRIFDKCPSLQRCIFILYL
jgi:hypothetical protein